MPPDPISTTAPDGMELHHVGVAVRSLETALGYYTDLFGLRQASEPVEVAGEGVRVCFVEAPPGILIELVEGLGEASPVADIVARTGAGPYHLCYRVRDLDAAIDKLRAGGCYRLKRFQRPATSPDRGPRRFAFLLTPDRQLFELCEAEPGEGLS